MEKVSPAAPSGKLEHALAATKPQIWPWISSLLLTGLAASPGGFKQIVQVLPALIGVVVFYAGGVSVLNDYLDRDRDRINHPERPIPAGTMSEREIIQLAIGVAAFGVLLTVIRLPSERVWRLLPMLALVLGMHFLYSLKPNLGFLGFARQGLLGGGAGLMVLIGATIGGAEASAVWLPVVLSGAYHYIVFVGKDFSDMPGDRERGVYTIVVANGVRRTGILYSIAAVIVYGALATAYATGALGHAGIPLSVIGAGCAGYVATNYVRGLSEDAYWSKLMVLGFVSSFAFSGGLIVGLIFR